MVYLLAALSFWRRCIYNLNVVVPACWDCVATVFFIDTAHNIVAYIENIWKILKPNGYWINMGW